MQTEFVAQEPDDTIVELAVIQELDAVLNWATALEFGIADKLTGYLAYYTNNSGLTDEVEVADLSLLPLDIQNVSVGADFVVGPALLTVGFGFGWGRKVDEELTDILSETNPDVEATFVLRAFGVLFGFEIGV